MNRQSSVLAVGACLLLASLACSFGPFSEVTEDPDAGRAIVYRGTGERTDHFFDSDQCSGPSEFTLTVNADKSVILNSLAKGFTFGMDGCEADPVETAFNISGTLSGQIVTFKECTGGTASGEAIIHTNNPGGAPDNVNGEVSCHKTSLTFQLFRVP